MNPPINVRLFSVKRAKTAFCPKPSKWPSSARRNFHRPFLQISPNNQNNQSLSDHFRSCPLTSPLHSSKHLLDSDLHSFQALVTVNSSETGFDITVLFAPDITNTASLAHQNHHDIPAFCTKLATSAMAITLRTAAILRPSRNSSTLRHLAATAKV